jgi:hypothetical protein
MSLSFMSQSNTRGSTTYVLYGSHPDELEQATAFQAEINAEMPGEVILLDMHSHDARALLAFYSITDVRTPLTLIINEADALHYTWTTSLPTIQDVKHHLRQIGD